MSYLKHEFDLYTEWLAAGKPIPPPPIVKQRTVIEYGRCFGIDIFIETGTFKGGMVKAVTDVFKKIYSIELGDYYYQMARARFDGFGHIQIIQGHSPEELKKILGGVSERCLFWLDAHCSGGMTVAGEKQTPILEELEVIFCHSVKNHIILVDDARCFGIPKKDYPALDLLRAKIEKNMPGSSFRVEDDIIRVCPKDNERK